MSERVTAMRCLLPVPRRGQQCQAAWAMRELKGVSRRPVCLLKDNYESSARPARESRRPSSFVSRIRKTTQTPRSLRVGAGVGTIES